MFSVLIIRRSWGCCGEPGSGSCTVSEFQATGDQIMNTNLTAEEESYLNDFLSAQNRGTRSLRVTANILLLAGVLLLVGTALYLSQNMTDQAAYSVGLPNFCGGILLVVCAIILSRRAANLKMLHSILSKLTRTSGAA